MIFDLIELGLIAVNKVLDFLLWTVGVCRAIRDEIENIIDWKKL